jgi:hypothetical protein
MGSTPSINAPDGNLQLTLVHSDTFPADVYVVLVPSNAPPGPLPSGYRLAGNSFSVRASGALVTTERPMSIRLSYNELTLGDADPHMLGIFVWNPATKTWEHRQGTLFAQQQYVATSSTRFTFYALMVTTTWTDDFSDFSGLDASQLTGVTVGGTSANRTLILNGTVEQGSATSQPIVPPRPFAQWGTVHFTATATPPDTTLRLDVLSADGTVLIGNVSTGTPLAQQIDPVEHSSLRLRATLSSTVEGQTPTLDGWQLSWLAPPEPAETNIELLMPLIRNPE